MQRKERKKLEEECNRCISNKVENNDVNIMFHAILDKNKTDRQLDINYLSGEEVIIGDKSNNLLIGVFVKTPKYGLGSGKKISIRKRREIENIIDGFLKGTGIEDIELIKMYDEVNCLE